MITHVTQSFWEKIRPVIGAITGEISAVVHVFSVTPSMSARQPAMWLSVRQGFLIMPPYACA